MIILRTFKSVMIRIIILVALIIVMGVFQYLFAKNIHTNVSTIEGIITFFLGLIAITIMDERIVIKEFSLKDIEMIHNVLRTNCVKELGDNRYKFSKLFSWDGIVSIKFTDEVIKVIGPAILIRKFK